MTENCFLLCHVLQNPDGILLSVTVIFQSQFALENPLVFILYVYLRQQDYFCLTYLRCVELILKSMTNLNRQDKLR